MPPHRRQPVLLDESALQNALTNKSLLRGCDGIVDQNYDRTVVPSTVKRNIYLLEPQVTRKRQLGSGMILLDENRLEQALKAKAERRQAAENSLERRRQTLSSVDRMIDSEVEGPITKEKPPKSLSKRRIVPTTLHQAKPVRATRADIDVESVSVSVSTSVQGDVSNRPSDQMIVKKKKIVRRVKKKRPENRTANSGVGSSSSVVVSASASVQASRPPPLSSTVQSNHAPRPTIRIKKQPSSSDRRPKPAASKVVPPMKINSMPPAPMIKVSTNNSMEKPLQHGRSKPPSKQSIATASTAKRSADSVSTLEDPSELVNASDHSRPEPTSSRSQVSSFRNQQPPSGTSRSKVKTTFNLSNLSNGSDHSQLEPTSHSQPGSYRKKQPPSWSVRNETKTGFTPNQYITKETMTHYTDNLGGVETVATTTKIFFDKAKYDPELKEFFHSIRWEHVRNEFIILANLEVPEKFDENIKGVLEHHCNLLENGANIDKLITIWESAIETSWLDHHMDDARQLIVGPSRVIFNLKALERHYAMHQKDMRAAARASRQKKKTTPDSGGGMFGRFRRGK
jgi:hypothetical protein